MHQPSRTLTAPGAGSSSLCSRIDEQPLLKHHAGPLQEDDLMWMIRVVPRPLPPRCVAHTAGELAVSGSLCWLRLPIAPRRIRPGADFVFCRSLLDVRKTSHTHARDTGCHRVTPHPHNPRFPPPRVLLKSQPASAGASRRYGNGMCSILSPGRRLPGSSRVHAGRRSRRRADDQ